MQKKLLMIMNPFADITDDLFEDLLKDDENDLVF